jgi:hypothetical protein
MAITMLSRQPDSEKDNSEGTEKNEPDLAAFLWRACNINHAKAMLSSFATFCSFAVLPQYWIPLLCLV